MSQEEPDIAALKEKLRSTWMTGDFGEIAKSIASHADDFIERLPDLSGKRVLDIACGTGNLTLPAAKAGGKVTGVDIAPNLVEQARERAEQEGVSVRFDEGDAEELPYSDASFDFVLSMYGAMFAPRPELVAKELLRVCKPGGRIAMANWTPQSFIGGMIGIIRNYVPAPPGMTSPLLWGDEATVEERLSRDVEDLRLQKVEVPFVYPFSAEETVEFYRRYYGPTQKAFDALDEEQQEALRKDLIEHWESHNRATDGTVHVGSEYLEVMALKG